MNEYNEDVDVIITPTLRIRHSQNHSFTHTSTSYINPNTYLSNQKQTPHNSSLETIWRLRFQSETQWRLR